MHLLDSDASERRNIFFVIFHPIVTSNERKQRIHTPSTICTLRRGDKTMLKNDLQPEHLKSGAAGATFGGAVGVGTALFDSRRCRPHRRPLHARRSTRGCVDCG